MDEFLRTYGFLLVSMTIQAMLALSLYLPLMSGQLSLAGPGFFTLGGYVAAILSTRFFNSPVENYPFGNLMIELLAAAVICGAVAVVVGFIALRLRGIFLALATISIVEIIRVLAINLTDITNGAPGISQIPQPFNTQFGYIVLTGPMLLIAAFVVYRIERVRVGRAFIAIREDELAASSIGINPIYYKVLSFTLGAILAGLAGVVTAHLNNTWNPSQATFDNSILYLAYVLVGGSRTFLGPIAGGLLLTALPEVLRAIASTPGLSPELSTILKESRLVIFGVLITLGALFFPQGLLTPDLFRRRDEGTSNGLPAMAASSGQAAGKGRE